MASGKTFEVFENETETVEFKEDGTFANRSQVITQGLDMTWAGWKNSDRKSLKALYDESACGLVVIHQEETDTCWMWGINPAAPTETVKYVARIKESKRTTGKKFDDANQAQVMLEARTTELAAVFTPGWAGVPL